MSSMNSPIPDTAALLPCPFCGESVTAIESAVGDPRYGFVMCDNCGGCCSNADTQPEANCIDAWNRRAAAPSMLPQSAGTEREPELPEPSAHMYPSDLERFQTAETFAQAFSVAVGNPDERSEPLFTESKLREFARASLPSAQAVPTHAPIQCGLSHATDAGGSGKA